MEVANHGSVRDHQEKFMGIINGIDFEMWDPADDEFLPMNYDSTSVIEGKVRHIMLRRPGRFSRSPERGSESEQGGAEAPTP